MKIVCLDLEGVLVPEIWIAFAEKTGIDFFKKTTRDEPNYDVLMKERIDTLKKHSLRLKDIQDVIATIEPLPGAKDFVRRVRAKYPFIILSDTFSEFALPLMEKLGQPTLFCNSLNIDNDGFVKSHVMRIHNGKKEAVDAFHKLNYSVFAAGDSYNDLEMIRRADSGALFCPPNNIVSENPDLRIARDYEKLFEYINDGE